MSSDGNGNPGEGEGENSKTVILLPLDAGDGEYVLECWKVKDGTLVRSGETIALACLASVKRNNENKSSSSAPPAAAPKHKRPSRRKRPTPAASKVISKPSEKNNGEKLNSIRFPPSKKETGSEAADKEGKESNSKPEAKPELKPQQKPIPIEAPVAGFVRIGGKEAPLNNPRAIGFIEPCSHPAVVAGLCAVCGVPMPKKSLTGSSIDQINLNSPAPTMSQVTVSGGLTFVVSKEEQFRMGKQNTQRLRQLKKLSLVLDLDATLVHATGDARAQQHMGRDDVRSIVLPGSEDARAGHFYMQHFVKLRPKVKEFLEGVREGFEIGVYTAGTRQYAEQIAVILCRHLVGAERDQIHLDQLRHRVANAEKELAAAKKAQPIKKEAEDQEAAEPEKKKRKVTFAEPPPTKDKKESPKRPTITAEGLLELESELKEAEEKENEALELRQRLFGSRIVSRSDVGDLGRDVKSLRRIFPCGGTMAAVVDDREDVWANAKDNISSNANNSRKGEPPENLLLVEAYHWQPFTGFANINNASGLNLAREDAKPGDKSGDELDEQLLWTKDILDRLHSRYYSEDNSDERNLKTVPEILSEMRKEVLSGQKIVLSGLVPLHKQNQHNDLIRPRPDAIRYVETMGATVNSNVHPGTTFVIAARDGTDKILVARRLPSCNVVKRSWLMQCYWSLTRRDPKPHLLPLTGRDVTTARRATTNLSPVRDVLVAAEQQREKNEEDTDEEDDALADEFEKDFL